MKGEGESSGLGGLIYKWSGGTTSAGNLGRSGPQPSLYTLSYSGGTKHGKVRMSFSGGAVSDVSTLPKKRPNPKNIPVTQEQLRGVLDPMTGSSAAIASQSSSCRPENMRRDHTGVRRQASFQPCAGAQTADASRKQNAGWLFGSRGGVRGEVCPDLRFPSRRSRHRLHVLACGRDRGLAGAPAGHVAVPALSNFRPYGLRQRLGRDDFLRSESRQAMIPTSARGCQLPPRQNVGLLIRQPVSSRQSGQSRAYGLNSHALSFFRAVPKLPSW